MTTRFTQRLNEAVEILVCRRTVSTPKTRSLFSPIARSGKFTWAKVMDSDGVLLAERAVLDGGEGAAVNPQTKLLVGVVIQVEHATSQTKPNPLGKASIGRIPNGVWVDVRVDAGRVERRRIDKLLVAFVLPDGTAPEHKAAQEVAARNVSNAAEMMPDVVTLKIPRGKSAESLADQLEGELRAFLFGPGRPRVR